MPAVWPYGRASTDKQSITIEAQWEREEALIHLKQKTGEWAGYEIKPYMADKSVTAAIPFRERPVGNYIFTHAERGDVVLVSNFDRIFRSVLDMCLTFEWLHDTGIGLVLMDLNIDTTTDIGQMVCGIIAAVKQYELKTISRRTKDAIIHNIRKRGIHSRKLGWKLVQKGGEKVPVPDQDVRRLGEWVVHKIDNEGWDRMDCYRAIVFDRKAQRILKRKITKHLMYTLYQLCKLGWPKRGGCYDRRPCRATTAS